MNDENVGSKRYDPVAMLRTLTPCPSPNGCTDRGHGLQVSEDMGDTQ